jgi:catecholate siderophore receptor
LFVNQESPMLRHPLALPLALFTVPALAQQAPVTLPEITVTADPAYAVPVISSATRTDTALRDTPQAITVLPREVIQDQSMQSMADAIRYLPGIGTAQGEGNRDTAIFRGNSSTADFYLDGMRDDVQYYRDFYNLDSIEALKGPNAMLFGRGGSGGIINRVTRQADGRIISAASLTLGSWNKRRVTVDVGRPIAPSLAVRLNAMADQSDSYRDGVEMRRSGINPTLLLRAGTNTTVVLGYEHFRDDRVADRGIPSYQGRPLNTAPGTFFGHAQASPTWVRVDGISALLEHRAGGITLRNRTRYADYDKFYQNVFPGAVNAAATQVSLSAYSNATQRKNLFNQSELHWNAQTGPVAHQLVAGLELGSQETANLRRTGYVGTASSVSVPLADPVLRQAVSFRQSATDADNQSDARTASVFIQDQVSFSPQWLAIVGVRHERFAVDFHNRRNDSRLHRTDTPFSPRLGIVARPSATLSLYGSYSIAFMPRAGEQLSSLSPANQAFDPERFRNLELGAKWEPAPDLSATAALFRLERSNVAIADPADATRSILVDGQLSRGLELSVAGKLTPSWQLIGGYAWQDARLTRSQSATALAGARLAQVPAHSLSMWHRIETSPALGLGLGLVTRSAVFASTSNTVTLPGFARIDAALFYKVNQRLRLQLNVENLLNRRYAASAHSNDNITPGAPRNLRLGLNGQL